MAEEPDQSATFDLRQVVLSDVIQGEALINLLERKGILTRQELLEEVRRVAAKLPRPET